MSNEGASVYILLCADRRLFHRPHAQRGQTRVSEHNAGINADYTSSRRPVTLLWSAHFERLTDAIATERRIKGWSRAKKEAFMRGDFEALSLLASRKKSLA